MARKIDFTKPLDEFEKAYVADRPWLLVDARLRGEDIIDPDDEFTVDDDSDEDSSDDSAGDESNEDGEADDEDEVAPYTEWDYQALKDEAEGRGLAKNGSKEQLIQRLEENDASAPE